MRGVPIRDYMETSQSQNKNTFAPVAHFSYCTNWQTHDWQRALISVPNFSSWTNCIAPEKSVSPGRSSQSRRSSWSPCVGWAPTLPCSRWCRRSLSAACLHTQWQSEPLTKHIHSPYTFSQKGKTTLRTTHNIVKNVEPMKKHVVVHCCNSFEQLYKDNLASHNITLFLQRDISIRSRWGSIMGGFQWHKRAGLQKEGWAE